LRANRENRRRLTEQAGAITALPAANFLAARAIFYRRRRGRVPWPRLRTSYSPRNGLTIRDVDLAGVFAPVATPFDGEGNVDAARLRRAFARWLRTPLTGFVVLGSNGEAAFLDEEESDRVIGAAREIVPRTRAFIAGTGRESTRATIAATRRAAALGADAVLVRTPGFFKAQMTSDAFVAHYTAVADASPVPVILYNFTAVTGVTLGADAVARLAAHANIVGMKESGGDTARIAALAAAAPAPFAVLAGSSTTFYASLGAGAIGGVLVLSSILPEACVRLFELARAGRAAEAASLQERLLPISQLVGSRHGVAGVKAALNLIGYDVGDPRPPLAPLDAAARAAIRDALSPFEEVAA
jgi:4-hydroxy-2-oxoglutarate aldolase